MATLGDLCDIRIGRTPPRAEPRYWGPGHPWLSIADMSQGRDILATRETITDAAVRERHCHLVPAGTIVFSFKLSVGKVGFVRRPLYTNEAIAALPIRNAGNLDPGYFYHALRGIDLRGAGEHAVKGVTLNSQALGRLKVPLPPMADQGQIAAVLDKADAVRRKRRESIQLLDEFLSSGFFEMFGDPGRNEKKWKVLRLGDCLAVAPRIGTITPATPNGRYPVVRVGDLGGNQIAVDRCKRVTIPDSDLLRFEAIPGDLLLVRAIGSEAHLGKASVVTATEGPLVFDSHVMRLRPSKDWLRATFLWQWLRTTSGRALFLRLGGRTAIQFNVNAKQVVETRIPLPPIEEQARFVHLSERVRLARRIMANAEELHGELAKSLAKRAFACATSF